MDVAHEPKTNRGEGWKELWQRNYFDLAFSLLGFEKIDFLMRLMARILQQGKLDKLQQTEQYGPGCRDASHPHEVRQARP